MREAIEKVLEAMREDYRRWTMTGREVHQNVEEFNRAIDIREKMTEEFCNGLEVKEGPRYWKIIASNGSGSQKSVAGFIAKAGDKKFAEGDMLKAAGWSAPARNFPRGNVLTESWCYQNVRWTGIG
jgi:predicted phage tail protein